MKRTYSFMVPVVVSESGVYTTFQTAWNSTDGATFMQCTGYFTGRWDMGDGTILTGETIQHTYAAALDGQLKTITLLDPYDQTDNRGLWINGDKVRGVLDLRATGTKAVTGLIAHSNDITQIILMAPDSVYRGKFEIQDNPNLQGVIDFTGFTGGLGAIRLENTKITKFISPEHISTELHIANGSANLMTDIIINQPLTGAGIEMRGATSLVHMAFNKVTTKTQGQFLISNFSTAIPLTSISSVRGSGIADLRNFQGGFNSHMMIASTGLAEIYFYKGAQTNANSVGFWLNSPKLRILDMGGQKTSGSCDLIANGGVMESFNIDSTGNLLRNISLQDNRLNQTYGFGTKILHNNGTWNLSNNLHSLANIDANINDIYTNRAAFNTGAKALNISGTGNAAPSGTFQAPAGFVLGEADGTPASAREQMYVLINQVTAVGGTVKKYNWSFTTN